MPDNSCDPLELEPGSSGSAGLLQSIRQNQLLCVNPPGSALLDSGALLPFLSRCCEFLLQQPLLLPTVPALWCGNAAQLTQVQTSSNDYCLQHLLSAQQWQLADLTPTELTALWQQVAQQPAAYTARQLLPLSQLPCCDKKGELHPQAGVLRIFSLLTDRDAGQAEVAQQQVDPLGRGTFDPHPRHHRIDDDVVGQMVIMRIRSEPEVWQREDV